MRKIFTILIVLFLVFSISFIAEAKEKVTIVCDPWPPFTDSNMANEGVAIEIIKNALKTQGYETEVIFTSWSKAVEAVKTSKYDLLPNAWESEERRKEFLFSDSIFTNELVLIKRKTDNFIFNSYEDLKGKIIGTVNGYSYNDKFLSDETFKKEPSNGFILNIRKLVNDRLDLVIEDKFVTNYYLLTELAGFYSEIEVIKTPLIVNPAYVLCSINNPRAAEIIEAFNKGLKLLKDSGVYEAIFTYHGLVF